MAVPAISRPVLGFFRRIVRGYFRRHFHGVRVSGLERFLAGKGLSLERTAVGDRYVMARMR